MSLKKFGLMGMRRQKFTQFREQELPLPQAYTQVHQK
jgi:hypothetical protein